jgi:ankyrin repeat protein
VPVRRITGLLTAVLLAGAVPACGDTPPERGDTLDRQLAYLIATSEIGDDPRLLELTLDAGADVDAKDSFNGTGLIRAAERGHVRIVRRLLRTEIDLDHVNRLGWTALLEAIVLGDGGRAHTDTVRLLVDAGADVHLPDRDGTTPLAHARRRDMTAIERILQRADASN